MSLIPRLDSDFTFAPLFRFLDEFSTYSRDGVDTETFTPKFDIHEHKHSYSLHGELPGVEKKDVEIEWNDPQVSLSLFKSSLTCKSLLMYRFFILSAPRLTNYGTAKTIHIHGKTEKSYESPKEGEEIEGTKIWRSERKTGEFSRTFAFPKPVDQEHVKATMKNGILNISVPKAKKQQEQKKITIS
jgi:HSP20 family protein